MNLNGYMHVFSEILLPYTHTHNTHVYIHTYVYMYKYMYACRMDEDA